MRRERAADFASETYAVIVGISEYLERRLCREFLSNQATRIYNSCRNSALAGIPQDNLRLLIDAEATAANIRSALKEFVAGASSARNVVIYFAGHSQRDASGRQWLLPSDASSDRLDSSALDVVEIASAIQLSRARSIVLFLDCCHSSGVAEAIMNRLSLPEQAYCRGVVAASRTDEESYVFPGIGTVFSNALVKVFEGRVPIGSPPGVVHFDELSKYLEDQVDEDLEVIDRKDAQHVVRTQWSSGGDSLLFTIAKVVGANVTVAPQRYSAEFVRRRIRQFAIIVSIALLIGVSLLYAIADGQQYATLSNGHVVIRRGFSHLNLPGLPNPVWETELPSRAVDPASILGRTAVLEGRPFQFLNPSDLDASLQPTWRLAWAVAQRNSANITSDVDNARDDFAGTADDVFAILALASPSDKINSFFFDRASYTRDEHSHEVIMRAWADVFGSSVLKRRLALSLQKSFVPQEPVSIYSLIGSLPFYSCADLLYVLKADNIRPTSPIAVDVLRAAARAGCKMPKDYVAATLPQTGDYAIAAAYPWAARDFDLPAKQWHSFRATRLDSTVDDALGTIGLYNEPYEDEFTRVVESQIRRGINRLEAGNTSPERLDIAISDDLLHGCLRDRDSLPVLYCIQYVAIHHRAEFYNQLSSLANSTNADVAAASLWAISMIAPPTAVETSFFRESSFVPAIKMHDSHVRSRWSILDMALANLASQSTGFSARSLGHTQFTDAGRQRLDDVANVDGNRVNAEAVIAMQGPPDEVAALLTSSDVSTRSVVGSYAAYNSALPEILRICRASAVSVGSTWPNVAVMKLSQEDVWVREYEAMLKSLPPFVRGFYALLFRPNELGFSKGFEERVIDDAMTYEPPLYTLAGQHWDDADQGNFPP